MNHHLTFASSCRPVFMAQILPLDETLPSSDPCLLPRLNVVELYTLHQRIIRYVAVFYLACFNGVNVNGRKSSSRDVILGCCDNSSCPDLVDDRVTGRWCCVCDCLYLLCYFYEVMSCSECISFFTLLRS